MMETLRAWIIGLPLKFHWLFVFLGAVLVPLLTRHNPDRAQRGEWYPFSNFPMYSDFEKQAYYVFLTDLEDKPVSTGETFGIAPSDIKKAYDKRLKELAKKLNKPSKKLTPEERQPIAEDVLRELRDTSKHQDKVYLHRGFRLHQVDITVEDKRIVERAMTVGEIKCPRPQK